MLQEAPNDLDHPSRRACGAPQDEGCGILHQLVREVCLQPVAKRRRCA